MSQGRDIQNAQVLRAMSEPFNIPGVNITPDPQLAQMAYVNDLEKGGFLGVRHKSEAQAGFSINGTTTVNFWDGVTELTEVRFAKHFSISVTAVPPINIAWRIIDQVGNVQTYRYETTTANPQHINLNFGVLVLPTFYLQWVFAGGGVGETADVAVMGHEVPNGARCPVW